MEKEPLEEGCVTGNGTWAGEHAHHLQHPHGRGLRHLWLRGGLAVRSRWGERRKGTKTKAEKTPVFLAHRREGSSQSRWQKGERMRCHWNERALPMQERSENSEKKNLATRSPNGPLRKMWYVHVSQIQGDVNQPGRDLLFPALRERPTLRLFFSRVSEQEWACSDPSALWEFLWAKLG